MKKIFAVLLMLVMVFSLAACGGSTEKNHDGEAKTPSGSKIQQGRGYQEVVSDFEESGFTNIQLAPMGDLITGWLTKEGEVESVSVGGDEEYSPNKWVPADTEVIIRSRRTIPVPTVLMQKRASRPILLILAMIF